MNRAFARGGIGIAALTLLSPVPFRAAPLAGAAADGRTVIVMSLDGFPAAALHDPGGPLPTLHRLRAEGAWARRLTAVNPSVTWPTHTTFVTGVSPARHGVLYNGLLVREGPGRPVRVEPWRDRSEMVRATTVYDVAHAAGLTTAEVDWVAIQRAPTITWSFPERPAADGGVAAELVRRGVLDRASVESFKDRPVTWRDQQWLEAAIHLLRERRPNLLLLHLLNLDAVFHRYGPGTLAGHTGLALTDANVRGLVEEIERSGRRGRTTLLVVSDHGFKPVRRTIRANALLREAGLLRAEGGGLSCQAFAVPEGGTAMVFVTAAGDKAPLVARLRSLFAGREGIARIIEPDEYPGLGLPAPAASDQVGDLVLVASDGYAFTDGHEGTVVTEQPAATGAHGYPATDPEMDALFIAWGDGVRRGAVLERARAQDVAPTVAALLGLRMGAVEGRVLEEFLSLPDR